MWDKMHSFSLVLAPSLTSVWPVHHYRVAYQKTKIRQKLIFVNSIDVHCNIKLYTYCSNVEILFCEHAIIGLFDLAVAGPIDCRLQLNRLPNQKPNLLCRLGPRSGVELRRSSYSLRFCVHEFLQHMKRLHPNRLK